MNQDNDEFRDFAGDDFSTFSEHDVDDALRDFFARDTAALRVAPRLAARSMALAAARSHARASRVAWAINTVAAVLLVAVCVIGYLSIGDHWAALSSASSTTDTSITSTSDTTEIAGLVAVLLAAAGLQIVFRGPSDAGELRIIA